jgi:Tfp pilus assembly protein PilO
MPELGNSRRKLKIAIGVMLAADVVAMAVLFSPLVGSANSRQQQLSELRVELQKKTREAAPLHSMPQKIDLAKSQINGFYKDRFAAKDSDLANELGRLVSQNGVRMQQAKYKEEEPES